MSSKRKADEVDVLPVLESTESTVLEASSNRYSDMNELSDDQGCRRCLEANEWVGTGPLQWSANLRSELQRVLSDSSTNGQGQVHMVLPLIQLVADYAERANGIRELLIVVSCTTNLVSVVALLFRQRFVDHKGVAMFVPGQATVQSPISICFGLVELCDPKSKRGVAVVAGTYRFDLRSGIGQVCDLRGLSGAESSSLVLAIDPSKPDRCYAAEMCRGIYVMDADAGSPPQFKLIVDNALAPKNGEWCTRLGSLSGLACAANGERLYFSDAAETGNCVRSLCLKSGVVSTPTVLTRVPKPSKMIGVRPLSQNATDVGTAADTDESSLVRGYMAVIAMCGIVLFQLDASNTILSQRKLLGDCNVVAMAFVSDRHLLTATTRLDSQTAPRPRFVDLLYLVDIATEHMTLIKTRSKYVFTNLCVNEADQTLTAYDSKDWAVRRLSISPLFSNPPVPDLAW